jgi:hypothetical protein
MLLTHPAIQVRERAIAARFASATLRAGKRNGDLPAGFVKSVEPGRVLSNKRFDGHRRRAGKILNGRIRARKYPILIVDSD